MTPDAYVRRATLWVSGADGAWGADQAWLGPHLRAPDTAPAATLLPARARGRASLLTRVLAEVVEKVLPASSDGEGSALERCAFVFGSGRGELRTTDALLRMMSEGDGALSPARFQASVHNTAAGQLSIALDHRGFSTSLGAGPQTVAASVQEAFALLASGVPLVLVAMADEPLPPGWPGNTLGLTVGVGLLFAAEPAADDVAHVAWRGALGAPNVPSALQPDPAAVTDNPIAAALPLFRQLASRSDGLVLVTPPELPPLLLAVRHCAGAFS